MHKPTATLMEGLIGSMSDLGYEVCGIDDTTPDDVARFYTYHRSEPEAPPTLVEVGSWREMPVRDGAGTVVRLRVNGAFVGWVSAIPALIAALIDHA